MAKEYKVEWTKSAKDDLINIILYIKKDSLSNAKNVYKKIKDHANSSSFFPLKGRIVPELQKEGISIYREIIVTPWRIVYTVGSNVIYIVAILDSRQNIEDILIQKIIKGQI